MSRPSLEDFRFTYYPIHESCKTDRYKIMLDYEEYLKTENLVESQQKANEICQKYLC